MIAYRDATIADAAALQALFADSFTSTFGHLYAAADLAAFLDLFDRDAWRDELADPDFAVRVAVDDGRIVGFCKIGPIDFPGDWPDAALEFHQLYVLDPWHGQGVAPVLIEWAIATARTRRANELILSVYVDNHRARRFYERYGFVEFGRYVFMVGDHADDDRLMRLTL